MAFNWTPLINCYMEPLSPAAEPAVVEQQLQKILSYAPFDNSQVLSGFLTFIVNETLAGRESLLKEYTIGTNVLVKKTGYDPATDASVRIHAGRLRRALNDYYSGPGRHDPLYMTVPKGSYIPKFETAVPARTSAETETLIVQNKPTLAVFPFNCPEESLILALADGLCDQVCTDLIAFDELSVISYYSSRKLAVRVTDVKEVGLLLDAQYLLTGSIQSSGGMIRIRVQLIQTATQRQVWTSSYEKELTVANAFNIQDDIVRHVVNQIGGSHGIIFREEAKVAPGLKMLDLKVYNAIFWYYHMVNNQNVIVFEKALESMKNAVQLDPQYALGWAVLSETYVAGVFNGFDCHIDNPLEEAVRCGKEALKNDLKCQHAYQSLALAYVFMHRREECFKIIEQWISLNSNAAAISGGLGMCLVCLGEYERGYKMISNSIHLNPYYPWWFNGGLSFYHFSRNEFEDSIYWAEKLHMFSPRWELIMKVGSYAEMGNAREAQSCFIQLRELDAGLTENPGPYISALIHDEKVVERLVRCVMGR